MSLQMLLFLYNTHIGFLENLWPYLYVLNVLPLWYYMIKLPLAEKNHIQKG